MVILQCFPQSGGVIIWGIVLSQVVSLGIFGLGMDLDTLEESAERTEEQSSPTWSQQWHSIGKKVSSVWGWHVSGQHLVVAGVRHVY